MFERLRLQGFQKHADLKVVLDSKITTFVGESDKGKSSILRALRWVCLNEAPAGDFIHWDAAEARMTLWLDGGQKVCRSRSKSSNSYSLGETEYKAFGVNVPDPIAKLVNTAEVSWQGQFDRHYLFSLTPPERARQLNAVVDLGVIDEVLATLAGAARKAAAEVNVTESRLAAAEAKVADLAYLADLDADLAAVEELGAESAAKAARLALCRDLAAQAGKLARQAA